MRVLAAVGVLLVRPRGVAHVRVRAGQRAVQQLLDVVIHALVVGVAPQEVQVWERQRETRVRVENAI